MYETKPGNGGHGLEVYDTETGKYADVTCHFGDLEIHNWEEYRDAFLESSPELKQIYNSNPQAAKQIDETVQDKMYPELLKQEVDTQNKQLEQAVSQISFKDPMDAAQNFHKIFGKKMVSNLLANNFAYYSQISVNPLKPGYKVSSLAACIQMNRYKGNNRMKPITRQEYEQRKLNSKGHEEIKEFSDNTILLNYIDNSPEILVNRTMGISNENVWQEVKRSFWDEKTNINSTLSRVGGDNCSYYGSVCYMSAGTTEYDEYTTHKIYGIIKNENLKLLKSPIGYGQSHTFTCNKAIPEINKFREVIRDNYQTVVQNLKQQFIKNGVNNDTTASLLVNKVLSEINNDPGVCAMLMGYDAIVGSSFQFDILNPNIVDMLVE